MIKKGPQGENRERGKLTRSKKIGGGKSERVVGAQGDVQLKRRGGAETKKNMKGDLKHLGRERRGISGERGEALTQSWRARVVRLSNTARSKKKGGSQRRWAARINSINTSRSSKPKKQNVNRKNNAQPERKEDLRKNIGN